MTINTEYSNPELDNVLVLEEEIREQYMIIMKLLSDDNQSKLRIEFEASERLRAVDKKINTLGSEHMIYRHAMDRHHMLIRYLKTLDNDCRFALSTTLYGISSAYFKACSKIRKPCANNRMDDTPKIPYTYAYNKNTTTHVFNPVSYDKKNN